MPRFRCRTTCTIPGGRFVAAGEVIEGDKIPNKHFTAEAEEGVAQVAAETLKPKKSGRDKLGDREPVALSELAPPPPKVLASVK